MDLGALYILFTKHFQVQGPLNLSMGLNKRFCLIKLEVCASYSNFLRGMALSASLKDFIKSFVNVDDFLNLSVRSIFCNFDPETEKWGIP